MLLVHQGQMELDQGGSKRGQCQGFRLAFGTHLIEICHAVSNYKVTILLYNYLQPCEVAF